MPRASEPKGEMTAPERRMLALAAGQKRRQNQFVRSNPKLAAALETLDREDKDNAREDIQEVGQFLLGRVIAAATADPDALDGKKAGELLGFVRSELMHQAKIDKLKADVESVTQNVATPTALRKLFAEYALCIQRGNEVAVGLMLDEATAQADRELIMRVGGAIFDQVRKEIQRFGQEDTSMARILAAMD